MSDGALPALWRTPERADVARPALDAWLWTHAVGRWHRLRAPARRAILAADAGAVAAVAAGLERIDDVALAAAAREAGIAVRRGTGDPRRPIRLFALVQEAAARTLGYRLHAVQVSGALSLWRGAIAEMATGEGKTAAAALCAAAAALSGRAVHVITTNDYLAARDAKAMAPLFGSLGLTASAVVAGMSPDARRAAYGAAVCYGASKEIVFDHLRDRLALGPARGTIPLRPAALTGRGPALLMRGLDFAIVDEADSVLVDSARTPLILSGEQESQVDEEMADYALALSRRLVVARDWRGSPGRSVVELTEAGEARLAGLVEADAALGAAPWWSVPLVRGELVRHALAALHLFQRDEHYLVRADRIEIIDEFSGRVMPDRQWADGLHQMVERKEGCAITRRRVTLARLTFQRFFPRYRHLCGTTGTAAEITGELWAVYGRVVDRIPPHLPCRRAQAIDRVLPNASAKWQAVAAEAASLRAAGRPVLIGVRTVAASRMASAALTARGLPHAVLSADQDAAEAATIARAGKAGRITVATNMAGRGTDIQVSAETAAAGGLAVLVTERHGAGRIDRQLAGRAARQGDPGSVAAILAADDPLVETASGPIRLWARLSRYAPRPDWREAMLAWALRRAQIGQERAHAAARQALLRHDSLRAERLGFAGMGE